MVSDINNFIKLCPNCNTSNKFKKLKVVKKLLSKMDLIIVILLIYGNYQKIFLQIPGTIYFRYS